MIRIDLGSVTFNTGIADASGRLWRLTIPEGWDAAVVRDDDGVPTGRDGAYEVESLDGPRMLVSKGVVRCPSEATAWDAYRNVIPTLVPRGSDITMTVYEPSNPLWANVRRSEAADIQRPAANVVFFELAHKALYPHLRGVTASTVTIAAGATVTVTHSGTFAAEFTATTTSSGTVRLASAGLQLECASVPSGTVFDSQEFTVTDSGGTDLYGLIEPGSEWPAVSVGAVDWINSGTADVDLTFYPTYA